MRQPAARIAETPIITIPLRATCGERHRIRIVHIPFACGLIDRSGADALRVSYPSGALLSRLPTVPVTALIIDAEDACVAAATLPAPALALAIAPTARSEAVAATLPAAFGCSTSVRTLEPITEDHIREHRIGIAGAVVARTLVDVAGGNHGAGAHR